VIVRENTECLYVKKERIEETPAGKVAVGMWQLPSGAPAGPFCGLQILMPLSCAVLSCGLSTKY
jgi:hypothetical protein